MNNSLSCHPGQRSVESLIFLNIILQTDNMRHAMEGWATPLFEAASGKQPVITHYSSDLNVSDGRPGLANEVTQF